MKDQQASYPQLRFKGFTDPWEQRKLIDLLNQPITDGPHETPNLVEKGIPFISADAIVDNRIDFSRKRGFITEEYDLQCRKKYGPELYDVYLVKSGSTVGKVAIVETTKQFNIWSPLAAMRCKGKTNPYFLYFLFQTKENQNQVKSKASNGTQPNLSMRELEQFNVQISPLHDEQQKIGAFFKQLDSLITLHQRKLVKLKELKQGYLQKMFPENGSKFPQLRFAGFADAWEQRKLLDIADRLDNLRVPITASDRKSGDTPYYGANGIQDYVEGFTHDGEFILVAEDGANDLKNYPVHYVNGKVWVNNHAHVLQGKKTITDNRFLMNSIKNFNIEPFLVGGGRAKLNADVMMKLNILLPTFDEQEKIGSFFKQLDDTITLHQRKLEKLQELKKGYLQKMFC
ncbi:restriction endonuclease subunit S [Lactiplantibacillus plantarum]|uniref:restriction endonuclease subunit S n=1 Tax=Lactiplantibacillus plantarum TaxID=1590 RepID=UPI00200B3084|nr:restriction endonuclease subunit S [Lactiplantibacillus plantarum]MCK8475154.1 restriction endonuclease subunit S [Lactiplantibacillus plantarum]